MEHCAVGAYGLLIRAIYPLQSYPPSPLLLPFFTPTPTKPVESGVYLDQELELVVASVFPETCYFTTERQALRHALETRTDHLAEQFFFV